MTTQTLYRRPLPADAIAFSSPEGRRIFTETLADGGLDGYFPLAEQFHTQADPAFCGLGSLVVALNALAIDPGRLWKGPWRWFGEELLACCVPLDEVRRRGLDLDELTCLARCNGAEVQVARADSHGLAEFREALCKAASGDSVLIAAYDRATLGQTGSGHYSPIGGYSRRHDLALILERTIAPLASHLEFRAPSTALHEESLSKARAALRSVKAFSDVLATVGEERADAVMLLLLAVVDELQGEQRDWIGGIETGTSLSAELGNLRAQLAALRGYAG